MSFAELEDTERRIINRYLKRVAILAEENPGLKVRVFDGEEHSYEGPFNSAAIKEQVGITDETVITVILPTGHKHSVILVHGNGEDVVSDCAYREDSAFLEKRLITGLSD